MRTDADATPLTVWVGSSRYVFEPGRDVFAGYGGRWDVPLEPVASESQHPAVVLRFAGTHWVAIDGGRDGMFVGGARLSQVDIRDGQAITVGDPQQGPRLTFNLGTPTSPPAAPPPPPPPPPPAPGPQAVPSRRGTQQMPIPTQLPTPAPPAHEPPPPLSQPLPPPAPVTPLPGPPTDALAGPRTTSRLPLNSGARMIGVAAHRLHSPLLRDVSFTARAASLTAVVGPSASRNAALLDVLCGAGKPDSGVVTVDGHDVYAEPAAMRARVGIVPRDNRIHRSLTVERAVDYAAELRLPPETTPEQRDRVVNQVLDELGLAPHRETRVGKLPPEVVRCAGLAIELVTRPSLLVVDEPGAGLDPEQEKHVMAMLRRQADLGCAVVMATRSQTYLSICDRVLVLTAAGETAFVGPGSGAWSEALARAGADPRGAHRAFLARQDSVPVPPHQVAPEPTPAGLSKGQQIWLVTRRQVRLLTADWVRLLMLVALPFALAGLTLLIPGGAGLGRPGAGVPGTGNPHEAVEILAALNLSAVIMGIVLTVGDLVAERRIFRREQAVGLAGQAYLGAKLIVFGALAAIQAAILTAVVIAVKGGPTHGAVLLGSPDVELYVSVAATAVVSAIVGLALSTLGGSLREVLPLVVPVILASLLFAGGLIPLVGTWGYDQLSWLVPAQWGFAASASTVDLRRIDPSAFDALVWTHYSGWWLFDMIVLGSFGALWAGFVLYRLRAPVTSPTARTA